MVTGLRNSFLKFTFCSHYVVPLCMIRSKRSMNVHDSFFPVVLVVCTIRSRMLFVCSCFVHGVCMIRSLSPAGYAFMFCSPDRFSSPWSPGHPVTRSLRTKKAAPEGTTSLSSSIVVLAFPMGHLFICYALHHQVETVAILKRNLFDRTPCYV